MSVWYGGRLFKPVSASDGSQTNSETIFKYEQRDDLVTATYSGGDIEYGQIIGLVDETGILRMRYQHLDVYGDFRTGICLTKPEILPGNKLRLHESWQWTAPDNARGTSILEEI